MSRSRPLGEAIDATPWIDVHEHLVDERHRLGDAGYEFTEVFGEETRIPGDWSALLTGGYAIDDLVSAGLPAEAAGRFASDGPEPLEKWGLVEPYLDAVRLTGAMRAVDIATERLFGLRLGRDTCEELDRRCRELRRPGYYRDVLVDAANVERCQVNSLDVDPFCETELPELFDQDISIAGLVRGRHPRAEELAGIEVGTLDDYAGVIEWTFERYAGRAVAAKCFWAYFRSLRVGPVDAPPRAAFDRLRRGTDAAADRRLVEDFLFRRCVELATAAGLPVKVHLGSLARNGDPHLEWVYSCVADMTRLVQEYPRTTWVLMHMAWPQQEQLLALAKHQPNVVCEMSWAWTAAPRSAADFLERFLTTVPATKLLGFGADYQTVENVVGHAELARRGLERGLLRLVDDGWMTMDDALRIVPLVMRENAARILPSPTRPSLPSVAPG
jgi:predicted TIM-barrel fold metal-dependent hydrolase